MVIALDSAVAVLHIPLNVVIIAYYHENYYLPSLDKMRHLTSHRVFPTQILAKLLIEIKSLCKINSDHLFPAPNIFQSNCKLPGLTEESDAFLMRLCFDGSRALSLTA